MSNGPSQILGCFKIQTPQPEREKIELRFAKPKQIKCALHECQGSCFPIALFFNYVFLCKFTVMFLFMVCYVLMKYLLYFILNFHFDLIDPKVTKHARWRAKPWNCEKSVSLSGQRCEKNTALQRGNTGNCPYSKNRASGFNLHKILAFLQMPIISQGFSVQPKRHQELIL